MITDVVVSLPINSVPKATISDWNKWLCLDEIKNITHSLTHDGNIINVLKIHADGAIFLMHHTGISLKSDLLCYTSLSSRKACWQCWTMLVPKNSFVSQLQPIIAWVGYIKCLALLGVFSLTTLYCMCVCIEHIERYCVYVIPNLVSV